MGATALALLLAYRRTALLLAAGAAIALAAGLPVTLLAGRLTMVDPGGPADGLAWTSPMTPVAELRQEAVAGVVSALVGAGGAVVGVAMLALLALAAARMAQREREVAVRRAVGASRRALLGGFAIEGGALALAALVTGVPAGLLLLDAWKDAWPAHLAPAELAPSVALVTLMVLLVVLGALFPILFARRLEVTEPADGALALRIPALLLGGALAVLSTGFLLHRHMRSIAAGAGTVPEPGLVVRLAATDASPAARADALGAVLARAGAVPGAGTPSLALPGALVGLAPTSIVRADCGPCWPFRIRPARASHFFVTADSFRALGARLVEGRLLADADDFGAEPVAVISQRLAREQFAPPAVGRQLMIGADRDRWYTVVGVVEDGPAPGLGATLRPNYSVYLSARQQPPAQVELVVPGVEDRELVLAALRGQRGIELRSPATSVAGQLAEDWAAIGWFGPRFLLEGGAMAWLAILGTFALMRLWVQSLALEIGVQRAVGAPRRTVLRWVLGRALGAGLSGLALGALLGPLFWDALRVWLPGLGGWSLGTLLPSALLLLLAAALGALLPAVSLVRTAPAALFGATGD